MPHISLCTHCQHVRALIFTLVGVQEQRWSCNSRVSVTVEAVSQALQRLPAEEVSVAVMQPVGNHLTLHFVSDIQRGGLLR